nr:hypothetical protein BaRGS_003288 [Batillaria attramentaria]
MTLLSLAKFSKLEAFHVAYTKNLCWVKNTYYIPMQDGIPKEIHKRDEGEITYYQWLVRMAEDTQLLGNPADRDQKKLSGVFCFWLSKRDGSFLIGFYLFVKLIYCVNVVVQFFLLNAFLAMDYNVSALRQMTNVQRYTVQCVLPINLFNEKIFIVLWFWLFALACAIFFNFFRWLYYVLMPQNRLN